MRLRNALGSLALACLLVTTGCNGDPPKADPTPSSDTPSQPTSAPTSSEPTVAPATGRLMKTSDATINAPEGWTTVSAKTYNYLTLTAPDGINGVTISDDGTVTNADTEGLVRQAVRNEHPKNPQVETTNLGSAPAVHLSYRSSQFRNDIYGAISENVFVTVEFTQYVEVPAAEQQQIIDSVLASFQWR